MVFERQLDNHHRIVAELEYSGKDFNLVTYFNINKDLPNDKPAMCLIPQRGLLLRMNPADNLHVLDGSLATQTTGSMVV